MTDINALLARAIATRQANGLSLKAYGAEGYTASRPFTYHAKDMAQRDRAATKLRAAGYTVEAL